MTSLISFAEFLAEMWVVVGSVWLLYRGVVYVFGAVVERGLPKDEKNISVVWAWIIVLGEIAFVGAAVLYLTGSLTP